MFYTFVSPMHIRKKDIFWQHDYLDESKQGSWTMEPARWWVHETSWTQNGFFLWKHISWVAFSKGCFMIMGIWVVAVGGWRRCYLADALLRILFARYKTTCFLSGKTNKQKKTKQNKTNNNETKTKQNKNKQPKQTITKPKQNKTNQNKTKQTIAKTQQNNQTITKPKQNKQNKQ